MHTVWLGCLEVTGTPRIISIGGEIILAIEQPESPGGPFRLTGKFHDRSGNAILRLENGAKCSLKEKVDV
jgi:hypothetical protein